MGGFLAFLADWWPFLLLIYLPQVTRLIMGAWAMAVRYRLDHDMPDELPLTAGQWLQKKLAEVPLGYREGYVRVVVTTGDSTLSIDGYHPRHGVIQLTQETYFKRDPAFWAIAGHELGHAVIHRRHRALSLTLTAAGWLKWILGTFGLALIVGNVLYAMPEVTRLAYYCVGAALALDILVLVDEGLASALADRLLQADGVLDRQHLRAARMMLVAAFMTYLAGFVAHVGLFTFWPRLVELIGSGRFDGVAAPLEGWRLIAVALATLILAGKAFVIVKRIVAPPQFCSVMDDNRVVNHRAPIESLLGLLSRIALLVALFLLWDQAADSRYWWCVLLAFIPALGSVGFFLSLPLSWAYLIVALAVRALKRRFGGIEESPIYRDAVRVGKRHAERGDAVIAEIIADSHNHPAWSIRLSSLARTLYMPLLVAYWLMI